LLRSFPLVLAITLLPVPALAQSIPTMSAADRAATSSAAQSFGTQIRTGTVLPTQNASGVITLPGANGKTSTITADKLIPSQGTKSTLNNLAGNDAGVGAATSAATLKASKSASPWGQAYRVMKANGGSKHIDLTNDPIWAATDASMAATFSKSFANCVPPTGPTTTTSWMPDIKHCIANSPLQFSCHIIHKTGTKLVLAPKRCESTTFSPINKTLYSTPIKTIKDKVTCSTAGNFVHNLSSDTLTDFPHKCTIVDPVTNTCNITHSYSVTGSGTCNPGQSTVNKTLWLGNIYNHWVGGTSGVNLGIISSCGTLGAAPKISLYVNGDYHTGASPVCGGLGSATVTIPTTAVTTSTRIANLNVYNSGWCGTPYVFVNYTSSGCDAQGQCPVTLYVDDGSPPTYGCSDGSTPFHNRNKRGPQCGKHATVTTIPTYKTINITLTKNTTTKKVTDNGWIGHPPNCASLISDINAGTKTGTYTCGLDPSNGQQCVNLASGRICQSDMSSPFTGISSLCQRVDVSATTPRKDHCKIYKNDPNCKLTSSKCAAGTCNNSYICTKNVHASHTLSGCTSGCSVSL